MNNFFYHDGVFSVLETYDGDIFRVQTKKAEESARKMGISEYCLRGLLILLTKKLRTRI